MLEPCGSDFRLVEALHARDYNVIETEIILWEEFFDFKKTPFLHLVSNPSF